MGSTKRSAFALSVRLSLLLIISSSHFLHGCAAKVQDNSREQLDVKKLNDVREAVFRYLFQFNRSSAKGSAKVYCLSIEDSADPSEALLHRFSSNIPPVKPFSECRVVPRISETDPGGYVIDTITQARGLHFTIDTIRLEKAKRAIVKGGYYEGVVSASTSEFVVVQHNGNWKVEKERLISIAILHSSGWTTLT